MSASFLPSSFFSFQRLTAVVKVWTSSSMRRTRPKEPSRSFQSVSSQSFHSQPSPPARVPGSKKRRVQQPAKRQPKTTFKSRFRFLSFRFCDRSACPALRIPRGRFKRHTMSTVDTRTASGQPVRFFCLVRTTTATRPAWFSISMSHHFTRAFQSSLSRIRFHRMTIAQRTTLSNQLRLCRIPKHPRC